MLSNYLKAAFRSLYKQKGFSMITLLGLALGLTAVLLIGHYVSFELGYDQFHPDSERMYRVSLSQYQNGELSHESAENYPALGPALVQDLPEVEAYARLYNLGAKNNMIVTREDTRGEPIRFKQRRLLYADQSFLPMFGYAMKQGNAETALAEPFSMVITESYANKYFPNEDPIGKMLRMQDDDFNDENCRVTGIVADPPANTHLKFDVLISYRTLFTRDDQDTGRYANWATARYDQSWRRKDMYTYIRVTPNADEASLAAKLPGIIDKYMPDLAEQNRREVLSLQPLSQIHLYSHLDDEPEVNGDGNSIYFLLIIAGFILLIAYVNYINLATARSLERANEVGVRKVMGAQRGQLIRQFLIEASLMNLGALLLAVILYSALLPLFGEFAGLPTVDTQIWNHALWNQSWFIPSLIAIWIAGALLSGMYPAFVLSSFRPVQVLSRKFRSGKGGSLLRRGLVVFQFAACVALLVGTFTVYDQLSFMRSQDLGFNPEQVIVVERPGIEQARNFRVRIENARGFKEDLTKLPHVSDVTSSTMIPGRKVRWRASIWNQGQTPADGRVFNVSLVDFNFATAFGLEVIAGRSFSREFGTDADTACLVTRKGAETLGYQNPEDIIGKPIIGEGGESQSIVVGVVEDYHQESLHEPVPAVLFIPNDYAEFYLMRVSTQELASTLDAIEDVWETRYPGNPFDYFFMDEYFDQQYRNDRRFGRLFGAFALLAMLVGCLGLFGLSAYMTQQRFKEIGVRKVLGATTQQIWVLLTRDFLGLVLLANVIAWPLIAWIMYNWLEGFALRTSLNWWLFGLAGLAVLGIALLTVSYQAYHAATTNPVRALRTE